MDQSAALGVPDPPTGPPPGPIEASGGQVALVEVSARRRMRVAVWPATRSTTRGAVLLLNGRAHFMEKDIETVGELRARGFAVASLDWIGQGGSDRVTPGSPACHIDSFDTFLRDLDIAIDGHIAPTLGDRPRLVVAHSMGGHLALRYAIAHPEALDRLVLIAPMLGLRLPLPAWLARSATGLIARHPVWARRYAPGQSEANWRSFETNQLTSSAENYARDGAVMQDRPDLVVGGATWGWVAAALRSIAAIESAARPGGALTRLTVPTLIVLAGHENLVDNDAARRIAAVMPAARIVELPTARHVILSETDEVRAAFWAAFDGASSVDA